jgi:uncharacterized RDD family membrane protein YckC
MNAGGISLAKGNEGYDPIPPIEDLPPPHLDATAWQRFWSKTLDITLWSLLIGLTIALTYPEMFAADIFNEPSGRVIDIVLLPFAFVLDAVVQSAFGSTPGRALMGIRVEMLNRQRLSLGTALARAVRVWCFGAALGIPIAALFTYKVNFDKLKQGCLTSWDEKLGTRVHQVSTSPARTWIVGILTVMMLLAVQVYAKIQEQEERTSAETYEAAADLSTNPDPASPLPDPIEAELKKAAAEIKPTMVDNITRLDGVRVEGRRFIYDYTILRRDISDDKLREYVRTKIRTNMCNNADTSRMMKEWSVIYSYSYTMPNADTPVVEEIAWADCS